MISKQNLADAWDCVTKSVSNFFESICEVPKTLWGWLRRPQSEARRYEKWIKVLFTLAGIALAALALRPGKSGNEDKEDNEYRQKMKKLVAKQICLSGVSIRAEHRTSVHLILDVEFVG